MNAKRLAIAVAAASSLLLFPNAASVLARGTTSVTAGWNALYFHEGTFRTEPNKPAQWNRGAYLVEGLAHCGACHTPKNKLGAPKKDDRLEGGYDEHWYASNLTGDLRDGLGAWSAQEIADVATYIRNTWGNRAGAVSAGQAAKVREEVRLSAAK